MKKEFRIWDTDLKYYYSIEECAQRFCWNTLSMPGVVIEQYIGKTDVSGKKIFEGDIIEYTEKLFEHGDIQRLKGQVIYDTDYATFAIAAPGDRSIVWNLFSDMVISNFKVIGNINENPEILKI